MNNDADAVETRAPRHEPSRQKRSVLGTSKKSGDQGFPIELVRAPIWPPLVKEQRDQLIAEAAYRRAESRGFAPGHALQDWLEAEAEIDLMCEGDHFLEE